MAFRALSIRDPAVQELIWQHIDPTDIHPEYTKLDALTFIAREVTDGNQFLWGDETALLRCEGCKYSGTVNPHIYGDGTKFRALLTEGLAFAKQEGWTQVYIHTTIGQIQRMAFKLGFEPVGHLKGYHVSSRGIEDIAILRKEL